MEHDATAPVSDEERKVLARSELHQAIGWIALGLAVFVGSWRMDRLESQNINPYTVPGLLPGLLGSLLGLRSWRRGALAARTHGFAFDGAAVRRVALIIGLCVTFGVVLVGHGLPFWLAAALFVSVAIVVLQRPQRIAAGETLGLRRLAIAAIIGLGAGGIITLVFQQVFLVRLP